MNKLEMQTLEASRLLRMTTTERVNHERVKLEILAARPRGSIASVTIGGSTFELAGAMSVPSGEPDHPRRLDTVQLAGSILETNEEVAVTFTPDTAGLPDAEMIQDVGGYRCGDIVRRSVIGAQQFAELATRGWIAPVKRPGDGTARDYVVAEGNVLVCYKGGGAYHPGETLPDYVTPGMIAVHLMGDWIVAGK